MNEPGEPTNPADVVQLLAHALMRAGEEADRAPLDLCRVDLCIDITDLHARAIAITWPDASDPIDVGDLGLLESLERAEVATRRFPVIEDESATSELVVGLCDAIREVRSRV